MDDEGFGVIGIILYAFGGLLVIGFAAGGIAYAMDAPLEATIIDKECNLGGSEATVRTKLFGVQTAVEVEYDQCLVISDGNFVQYHIRTEHTKIYEREGGACIWDTVKGYPC